MRNPNGYGSVVKLSGNRRRPYVARKTVGWNDKGHPIYKAIGYYADKKEAMIALANYNHSPWNLDRANLTLDELFELWKEHKGSRLGTHNYHALSSAYNYLKKYGKLRYKDIKSFQMQDTIDNCGKGYSTQGHIKSLWNHLDKTAMEFDLIQKSYASLLTSEATPPSTRNRFTDAEIDRLWELYDKTTKGEQIDDLPPNVAKYIDTVLIFIYTGFRISELIGMKTADVDINRGTFKGGVKTAAGKNRIVPIHSLIYDMVKKRVSQGNEFFVSVNGKETTVNQYRYIWQGITRYLAIDKTPHEARHTFESLLDSAGANRKCIDLMMGHVSKDVGNRVYNHKTLEELRSAIELVTR